MHRRKFLAQASASAAGAVAATVALHTASRQVLALANDRVTVCVAGVRGRGGGVLNTFACCRRSK